MIIDPIRSAATGISADTNAKQVKDSNSTNFPEGEGVRATLSSDTASVGSLVARAMQTPAVRQDRVDALRTSIRNGSYPIDAGEIASAMLREQASSVDKE